MKFAFLGTLPQWLTLFAVGWLIYMVHHPVVSNRTMDVYVENFPRLLEGASIPVTIQASVPLEMNPFEPIKIAWPDSISMDLLSVGGKKITVSPFGVMQVPKPSYQTSPSFINHMDLGLSVDVKSIAR